MVTMDEKFHDYYNNKLKRFALFITDNCQLKCRQCMMKPSLRHGYEIPPVKLKNLIDAFTKLGASRMALMGGEPSLYDKKNNNQGLLDIIEYAKNNGIVALKMDTNGQDLSALFADSRFKMLDELIFSIDGPDAKTNESMRIGSSFNKVVTSLMQAKKEGMVTQITSCVGKLESGEYFKHIDGMINLAKDTGADALNFHPLLKQGIEQNNWSENTEIDLETWHKIYEHYKDFKDPNLVLRISKRAVPISELTEHQDNFCFTKEHSRLSLETSGSIRACPLSHCTDRRVGYYDSMSEHIFWETENNEADIVSSSKKNGCVLQTLPEKEFAPLCLSYKDSNFKNNEYRGGIVKE